ncbi:URC4/urg3 family protein [Sporobolomyces koalae]|uniref:URC4/urg3 family protein n=1 Tax=Sporobolomyces koalae TaxID=500713 RepID=UPI003174DF4D
MTSSTDLIAHLRSLDSIRERCEKVFALAQLDQLEYWTLNLSQEPKIVDFVCELIERDYDTDYDSIPPHGRWRHFVGNRVDPVLDQWNEDSRVDDLEKARRLVDLMVVSVLMDAGAGNEWKYSPKEGGDKIARSEGLAVGSLEMFEKGTFSSVQGQPFRVDAAGLSKITASQISDAMQVSESNPMTGIEGRAQLLIRLADVLTSESNAAYFAQNGDHRPGYIIDYLLSHPTSQAVPSAVAGKKVAVKMETMWEIVVQGLSGVWPAARSKIDGVSLGDVWPVDCLKKQEGNAQGDEYVSFHKLSQWLTYSLIEVMEKLLGWSFIGKEKMTGLPEYRNGGLLIDFRLLDPKIPELFESFSLPAPSSSTRMPSLLEVPPLDPSHSAVVEMRAVTIIMLDRLANGIRNKLGVDLTLPQVLEAGTWKAGREIAKKLRPETGGPPFAYVADGTVF